MKDLSRLEVGTLVQREAEELILGTALLFLIAGSLWSYFALGRSLFDPSLLLTWFFVQAFSIAALRFRHLERALLIGSFATLHVHFYVAIFRVGMPFVPAAPVFFLVSVLALTGYRSTKLARSIGIWALAWASVFLWLRLEIGLRGQASFLPAAMVITFAINTLFIFTFFWTSQYFSKTLSQRIEMLGPHNRFDEQRIHASKLQSLGELSASLLHEIINPVLAISGFSHQIKGEISENSSFLKSPIATANDRIKANIDRIMALTRVMRIYSRDSASVEMENLSLQQVLGDAVTLMQHHLKASGIEFSWQEMPQEIRVFGNVVELSQLLVNLLSNARDACENSAKKVIHLGHELQGQHVRLWVDDSGIGIDPRLSDDVFRPFFTTKGLGKGTGLGLSIARLIADRHQGKLSFEALRDAQGRSLGTRFVFEIPLSMEKVDPVAA